MSEIDMGKVAFTSAEAARILNINVPTLKGRIEGGQIKAWHTNGGHLRIDRRELRRVLAEQGEHDPFTDADEGAEAPAPQAAPDESLWVLSAEELTQLLQDAALEPDSERGALLRALSQGPLSAPELAEAIPMERAALDALLQAALDEGDLLIEREAPARRYCLQARAYLLKLLHNQPLSVPELAHLTGLSASVVQQGVNALVQARLVVAQRGAPLPRLLSAEAHQARAAAPAPRALSTPRAASAREPARAAVGATGDEHLLSWCQEQCAASTDSAFKVKLAELVNRRGRFQANARLRAKAVQDVANFLFEAGFSMSPDFRERDDSPGIETAVWIRFIQEDDADEAPAPVTAAPALEAPAAEPTNIPTTTAYEGIANNEF